MKLNLYTNNMERQELLELVISLTVKNMDLEKEIKRLNKQTDRLWEDLKEYEKDQDEEFDFDYDDDYSPSSDLDVPDYDENNYPSVESSQKINSINARLNGTNSRVVELEKRVQELDRWAVAQSNLADIVSELEEKVDNYGK